MLATPEHEGLGRALLPLSLRLWQVRALLDLRIDMQVSSGCFESMTRLLQSPVTHSACLGHPALGTRFACVAGSAGSTPTPEPSLNEARMATRAGLTATTAPEQRA